MKKFKPQVFKKLTQTALTEVHSKEKLKSLILPFCIKRVVNAKLSMPAEQYRDAQIQFYGLQDPDGKNAAIYHVVLADKDGKLLADSLDNTSVDELIKKSKFNYGESLFATHFEKQKEAEWALG
jgi:hypothetical protein